MPAEPGRARVTAARIRRAEIEKAGAKAPSPTNARSWLLLTYKVPAGPAKRRIARWRKLKALGAIYLQSGVCLPPNVDPYVRRLKVLRLRDGR